MRKRFKEMLDNSKIQYPKGEIVWVNYANSSGEILFIMTSKNTRDYYYLYEILDDGKIKKLGKSRDPPELEEKYHVMQTIFRQ